MKKLNIIIAAALLCPAGARDCRADYKDMANQVETVADFWLGGYLNDSKNSVSRSLAEERGLATTGRVATNKASEYYSLNSSGSGGVLLKGSPLPNRYHLEVDYYNDKDWFGDLRYSYKDYLQFRLLPRRFSHNLDNLTIYDFNPAVSNFLPVPYNNTAGNDVQISDASVENYGLRIDIDQYRVRLKTPKFPLHVYSEGEIVSRKGLQQMRFMGAIASNTAPGRVRASESRVIDQKSQEYLIGTNTHLGPVEIDLSHRIRKFENDRPAPTYDYNINTTGGKLNYQHNVTPELKATTNTVKLHTSHSGRIVASATYSEIDKTNEYSGAEAKNSMGYGELVWLPAAYISIAAKVRQLKNEASAPANVVAPNRAGVNTTYIVSPGVASTTDFGSLAMRYSLVPKTNFNVIYSKKIKQFGDQSAIDWSRPLKQTSDVYEMGFTNWVIPKVRLTGKLSHTRVGTDFGMNIVDNNLPEQTNQGTLGFTWSISPKLAAFFNATAVKEKSEDNRMLVGSVSLPLKAESLREQYLASCSYRLNDKVAITPTYTYMSYKQQRDMVFNSALAVDSKYSNKQEAQNFALNLMFVPTGRLNINTVVDYTITKGNYDPTSPFRISGVDIITEDTAMFSESNTEEINVRLDSEYDLGRGWGLGLGLRYVDWKDSSIDNPSEGTFIGGLFKVSKKLFY